MDHFLYLELPKPLKTAKKYTVAFVDGPFDARTFTFDPSGLRSEAVHVSHLGFLPDDPAKAAFLSCWMGTGGGVDYGGVKKFRVLEEESGRSVFEGEVKLSKAATERDEDAYKNNHNGTDVYIMDFSSLKKPGTYRVCVEGIGCSYPFEIGGGVWRKAFRVSARGFYHQRSGIEIGPPYTEFRRPRAFHPDDGVKVYASAAALMDTGNGLDTKDSNFGNLVKGKTDEIVPNAWGGYMDAGDWDRRIQHLDVSRLLIELAELFPDYFAELSLNIPESKDGLPDVVSEALFNLDCYRRMQTKEGGIRGGIESEEHPRAGEASWQESLTVLAYAPGVWSSYYYAGVAARAAHFLAKRDPKRAKLYRESALRAMRWAEKELPKRKEVPHPVHDMRNLAAAELFRLTGKRKWHELFLDTTVFKHPKAEIYVWTKHEQRDAPWVYVRTKRPGKDETVEKNCRSAIIREADKWVLQGTKTGFRWTMFRWRPVVFGALSSPDAVPLVRAHVLTGEEKYLRTMVLACQTGAGANPVNMCYTTGLGHRYPRHPLNVDARISRQTPPPGLTVGGPCDPARHKDHWGYPLVGRFCHPSIEKWPSIEAFCDVFWNSYLCEYAVHVPMATNAYVWGYLAARK
jgi:endoglucanase